VYARVSYLSLLAIDVWSLFGNPTTATTHAGRPATRSRFSCPRSRRRRITFQTAITVSVFPLSLGAVLFRTSSPCPRRTALCRRRPSHDSYYNTIIIIRYVRTVVPFFPTPVVRLLQLTHR